MIVKIELSLHCDQIEDLLQAQHNLDEPVKLIGMEYDSMSDLCALEFEVDSGEVAKINRDWSDWDFAEGLVADAL
jgi:hypothetical protein